MEDREHDAARERDSGKITRDRPSSSRLSSTSQSSSSSSSKRARLEAPTSAANIDADEPLDDSDEDSDDSDSDDDDTAALMAELQKIKREKAADEQEKVCMMLMICVQ